MDAFLFSLIPFAVGAVAIVLALGLWNLVRKDGSASLSQTLMRWRVGLQALAIVIIVAALWLAQH